MIQLQLFYIILLFFFLGGIGTYFANRKQNPTAQKKNWLKYFTYFFIIAFLYGSICFAEKIFLWICSLIALAGLIEIIRLQKKFPQKRIVFYPILFVYVLISTGFYFFGNLSQPMVLYTLFTVCTFDAFSQIAGQLFGKTKLFPQLSPNKTYEGLLGGLVMSVGTCFFVGKMLDLSVFLGFGICVFSFAGDLSASWVKRKYGVKDFSLALPGHGGFLDRFDSFIVAGAFVYLFQLTPDFQLLYWFLYLSCFFLVIIFCEFLHKKGFSIEYTRKLGHSLSSLSCLFLPFFFTSHWYVLLLTISSFAILYIGNRKQLIHSICSVGRKTFGAYVLPISIGITYYISVWWLQNNLIFIASIAVLAISDPLACYFGKRFKSKILNSGKTIIGTLAFFLSTFIICALLLWSQSAGITIIGIAVGVSVIVSVVELISPKGSDNLTVPLSVIGALLIFDTI
ncbi:MAG: phosphatidate cytidylyltransferase [Bacteroidetes bacterium]|nr:phosphatidate cytidylyltransferase [Bacteroidota bacterium]